MKIKDLKTIIDTQLKYMPSFAELDVKVLVREKGSSIGARPSVIIEMATFGFDFENGLLLMTKEPICKIKP